MNYIVHGVTKSQTWLSDFHREKKQKQTIKGKHMKAKQHASEKSRGHWRNQRENLKVPRSKRQWYMTTKNLGDTVKAIIRGKFIAIQAYLKKQENHQINHLTLHL